MGQNATYDDKPSYSVCKPICTFTDIDRHWLLGTVIYGHFVKVLCGVYIHILWQL